MNLRGIVFGAILGCGAIASPMAPVSAESCKPLQVIGSTGTEVSKNVSPPGTLFTADNWNTDFAVPSGARYNRYVATIVTKKESPYTIKLFFKYSDNTSDNFFDRGVQLYPGKPLKISGTVRANADPYQINVLVGGINATGTDYTLSVSGCY